ncbi:Na+ channel, amiloride-sensitive family and Degenerin family-containing protein [Aphelenchoides besseyi]|nr:Na+ channel, amiloride-sensitive family and Degenerin family-containing protein [Aphelenchoides besseyi]
MSKRPSSTHGESVSSSSTVISAASSTHANPTVDALPTKRKLGSMGSTNSSINSAPPALLPRSSMTRPSVTSGRSLRIQLPVVRDQNDGLMVPPYVDNEELSKIRFYRTSRRSNRSNRLSRYSEGPQPYHSIKDVLVDFCARTSSHGIPMIGTHSFFGPYLWSCITSIMFIIFCTQTYLTMYDYLTYRTIIEMQLKFDPGNQTYTFKSPFPAATLCNLNAFKSSELRKFEEFEQGFQLYERAVSVHANNSDVVLSRKKRHVTYQPVCTKFLLLISLQVYVKCVCNSIDDQCVPQHEHFDLYLLRRCTDRKHLAVLSGVCVDCQNLFSLLEFADLRRSGQTEHHVAVDRTVASSLHLSIDFPLLYDQREEDEEVKWWNPDKYRVFPATEPPTPSPEINDVFGAISEIKGLGAITIKAKENLIFMVATMPKEVRKNLSYTLNEFVLRCSFNSEDCDIERDFQLHMDPEFGNCFTFNFNDSVELKNSRAGPMYGLRLLLNVNQSDYLPTTEAAGIRLVVHEQDQEPFPDTFGYSAPTGFVSSFGLKTKVLQRLNEPYGHCSDTFRPENYIYAEHYSPEGCYRNCFQQIILERCHCGDPRFPLPTENDKPCDVRNQKERLCLMNQTSVLGGFHHLTHDCKCVQPCTENVFETAYSAAAWPALNFNIGADCETILDIANDSKACAEYYRLNTAYIEIFYEQLNYETLKETPGYTLVNLFSDLGGNIGLCIGFSLITFAEVVELLFEMCCYAVKKPHDYIMRRRRQRQKRLQDECELESYLNNSPQRQHYKSDLHTSPKPSILHHYGELYRGNKPRFRHTNTYKSDFNSSDVQLLDSRESSIDK